MHALHYRRAAFRHAAVLVGLTLFGALSACVTTRLVDRWRAPDFTGPPLHKVLVVGVQRDSGRRRVWEDAMVQAMRSEHIQAIPSYQRFPDKAPSAEELAAAASQDTFDGVLATHFVSGGQRNYWMPGYAGIGFGWRWRYYGYWDSVYGPGYVETEYRADFQTDVFTVAPNGGKLIWTGITRSIDLNSIQSTTSQISHVLVPDLIHEGILAPT
jgi:hypothetical protein